MGPKELRSRTWPIKATWRHRSRDPPIDSPYAISYCCPIETEALSSTVFEIFGPKSRARAHADIQAHRHTLQVIYILSLQYIALDRQKSEKIAPKSTLRTQTTYVVPTKLQTSQTTPLGYACIRRQTTRLRNMNADISRSLLQSKNSMPTLLSTFSVCHRRPIIIGLLVLLR